MRELHACADQGRRGLLNEAVASDRTGRRRTHAGQDGRAGSGRFRRPLARRPAAGTVQRPEPELAVVRPRRRRDDLRLLLQGAGQVVGVHRPQDRQGGRRTQRQVRRQPALDGRLARRRDRGGQRGRQVRASDGLREAGLEGADGVFGEVARREDRLRPAGGGEALPAHRRGAAGQQPGPHLHPALHQQERRPHRRHLRLEEARRRPLAARQRPHQPARRSVAVAEPAAGAEAPALVLRVLGARQPAPGGLPEEGREAAPQLHGGEAVRPVPLRHRPGRRRRQGSGAPADPHRSGPRQGRQASP